MGSELDNRLTPLRRVTEHLLDVSSSAARLTAAVEELYQLCADVTGLNRDNSSADTAESALPTGKALSPLDAARCMKDPLRTAAFLRGLNDAIREQRRLHPDRRVEIVYAGTGPFAPLALPLMTCNASDKLRFTLIDVHERSVELLGRLLEHFGVTGFVRAVVATDATAYVHPAETPPGIVIVETMQRSLSVEPQVGIARHLAPQLDTGGIVIPERIAIDLAFAELSAATSRTSEAEGPEVRRLLAGTVMELTKETACTPLDGQGRYPPAIVTCPVGSDSGWLPMLCTTIDVSAGHTLGEYESGLTYPEVLWQLSNFRADERIAFRYQIGPRPGVVWQRLADDVISYLT